MTKNPRGRAELKNLLLQLHGVDFSSDFHTLKSSQADALADMATTVGYRKPKNANGSTARYFFNYLNKTNLTVLKKTMKIKTSELTGPALDWAVAKCECEPCAMIPALMAMGEVEYNPSTNWAQGGLVIEHEGISVLRCDDCYGQDANGFCNNKRIPVWAASNDQCGLNYSYEGEIYNEGQYEFGKSDVIYGPTPLVAAMRCYVASKLGDEIEIPEELK